jgi:nicotinamidase/pyrazinamidase
MRTLILVDLQNDFAPGGALAVHEGDRVVPVANSIIDKFDLVVATQDWHPPDHRSFAANNPGHEVGDVIDLAGLRQILWPVHCVQNTPGADFIPGLAVTQINHITRKGTDPTIDSYSGFFDNGHRKATDLGDYLSQQKASRVYIMGLATDYCVKFTALDAVGLGYETFLIEDGCRGVNLQKEDSANAIAEMKMAGVVVVNSGEISER